MSTVHKTIDRLTRKIEILEAMIEDNSRQAYYETIRRSTVNTLLEVSLKANDIDSFFALVLDLLFSVETLNIEKKGAIFLYDKQQGDLVLRAHSNLSQAHVNAIRRLHINTFSNQILFKDGISFSLEQNDRFVKHLSDMESGGHYYIPIRTCDTIYGLIILFTVKNTPQNKDDISFFTFVADICVGALERINYSEQILDYQRNLEQQVEEQTSSLLEEKERLAVTLRSIGDGVITTDLDNNIVLINRITEQLTGWKIQEVVGRPVEDVFNIVNEKTNQPCENPAAKVLASGKIVSLANHTVLIAKDGSRYSIEDCGAPIFDKDSKIIGVVLVFRDVTAAKRTAEELLKIKKLESIGVLAGGIAHDFNNILTAILGNIELAGIYIGSNNEAYSLLQGAKKASLRAKDLTQQLLTFSKGGDPVKKTTPIGKTITESANFVLHGSSVSYQINIPDDLWLVDIDAGQISQVIQNLVINAKHAMPDGGGIIINCTNITDITSEPLCGLEDKAYVKITLQDNGCGISANYLEKIFDPYFTTKQEGSGLGLAISHSIISKHDGHISVKSQMGVGTTFTIYMPVSGEQTPHDLVQDAQKPETVKARILIMDDEQLVREIATHMLNRLGHEVLLAGDGQEAIDIFNEHHKGDKPIDIIIMDLTIPGGMGGQEAIQQILKIDPTARAIVSSGYSNDPVMTNYQEYGFKAAIAKPFLLAELDKILTEVSGVVQK